MVGRNGLFSGYKSQRTKAHKGTEGKLRGEGIREKKNTIERRTEPRGDTKKPGSGDKKSHEQERRNQRTELYRGEQIFAPVSSQRNRGVRASQNTWRKATLWLYKPDKAKKKKGGKRKNRKHRLRKGKSKKPAIPALLSSPERNQSEQKKTKKKNKQKREGPPESTNIIIGFPFYSASFHSQRKKLKRRAMSRWRKGTQTEGERTEAN